MAYYIVLLTGKQCDGVSLGITTGVKCCVTAYFACLSLGKIADIWANNQQRVNTV